MTITTRTPTSAPSDISKKLRFISTAKINSILELAKTVHQSLARTLEDYREGKEGIREYCEHRKLSRSMVFKLDLIGSKADILEAQLENLPVAFGSLALLARMDGPVVKKLLKTDLRSKSKYEIEEMLGMPRKKSRPPFMKLYVTNNGMDPDPRDLAAIAGEMLVATSEIARPYSLTLGLTYEVDEKLVDEYMDAVVYPREDAKLYESRSREKTPDLWGLQKEDEGDQILH